MNNCYRAIIFACVNTVFLLEGLRFSEDQEVPFHRIRMLLGEAGMQLLPFNQRFSLETLIQLIFRPMVLDPQGSKWIIKYVNSAYVHRELTREHIRWVRDQFGL